MKTVQIFVTEDENKIYEVCIDYRDYDQDDPFVVFKSKDMIKANNKAHELRNIIVKCEVAVNLQLAN